MEPNEQRERQELIAALALTFGKEATAPMLLGYTMGLDDISTPDLKRAVARAMKECQFMPVPLELRTLAGVPKDTDRAALAWEIFAKQVGLLGAWKTVSFDDPLINATCRHLGGWVRCCGESGDKFEVWLKKEFKDTYATLCRTGVSAEACGPLGGIADQSNGHLGISGPVHQIACDLAPHRRDLIRGDVPKALPQPMAKMLGAAEVGAMR